LQIAKAFGQDRVANAFDAAAEFGKTQGAPREVAENHPAPALSEKSKRSNQRFIARRRTAFVTRLTGLPSLWDHLKTAAFHAFKTTSHYYKKSRFVFRSTL